VGDEIQANRRRFLDAAAMTIAAQFGPSVTANDREPRELAARGQVCLFKELAGRRDWGSVNSRT
jgi:hypothetical protein